MRLRAIPPHTACKRSPREQCLPPGSQRIGVRAPHPRVPPAGIHRRHLDAAVTQRIQFLTDEIAQWLPELGEEALLALYEERARWAEGVDDAV